MGTPALLAVVCWLATSDIGLAKNVNSSKVVDHISEASAPRLYRNVPAGVYASAAPYGAYSIQFPRFISAPKPAASHVVPVLHNINGYLRDSYGNRFTGPPHAMTYKTAFPQQYVQIQELPDHLAQPLSASASPFQFQPSSSPQFNGGQFTFPSLQGPSPTPLNHFVGSSQPQVYAGNIRSLASPPSHHLEVQTAPSAQQQSTNKAIFGNNHDQIKSEPKFQRLQEVFVHNGNAQGGPSHKEIGNPEASPAQTAITTVVNGKKTVINVETNPPVPLLDLSLLEPLTFANPLVPQVQHFLPRIPNAVYHKLPQPTVKGAKNYQKEFVIQKTKSYDSGHLQGKPQKKKQKKPSQGVEQHHKSPPSKPTIIITSSPNESPEFSYEINSPNYKETYKEKAIKYNKETNSEPVHYSYGKKTNSEPVTYSYTHHSKEPAQIKHIDYDSKGKEPTQLIYNFKPDEQVNEQSTDSGESNEEIEQEAPAYHQREQYYEDAPKRANYNPEHIVHYEEVPKQVINHNSGHKDHYEEVPKKTHNDDTDHREQYQETAKKSQHKEQYDAEPQKPHNYSPEHRAQYEDAPKKPHNFNPEHREQYENAPRKPLKYNLEHNDSPKKSHNYNQEHREHYQESERKPHDFKPEIREQYEEAPRKVANYHPERGEQYENAPKKPHNYTPEHRGQYEDAPKKPHNFNPEHKKQYENGPSKQQNFDPENREHYENAPRKTQNFNPEHREQYENAPRKQQNFNPEHREQYENAPKKPHNLNTEHREQYENAPRKQQNFNPEHKEQYENAPRKQHNYNSEHDDSPKRPHNYNPEHREHYQESERKPHDFKPEIREQYEEAPRKVANYNPVHREQFEDAPEKTNNYNSEPKQQYEEVPAKAYNQEQKELHPPREEVRHEIIHNNPPKQYSEPIEVPLENAKEFEAITPEYEEDIRLLPTHAPHAAHPPHGSDSPYAAIKVDPSQHVQHRPPSDSEDESPRDAPQYHQYEREHHHSSAPHEHLKANGPAPHIHEQSKLIIMQEETPDEMHSLREQMMSEIIKQEENSEEDFENAYKNAAVGFPTFEKQALEIEKSIYDPRGYGEPRDHVEYVIEHAPFQQYQEEGDDYPKSLRSDYKDARDKNKEEYYLDYSVARPESLSDRYHKKDDYFKLYKQQKPGRYYSDVQHDDKKEEKQSAQYTVLPTFSYNHEPEQNKKKFAQYKAAPQRFVEFDYSTKQTPRDNSAFASRPHQLFRSRTHFVEPQFQYGFEPISLPRLLDSELSAMASNDSPDSEKPGTRKKIYKENWYIKKTSTSGVEPAS